MKKFSMGMMLSSLLAIQVGCGEEAPVTPPAADPAAMMHSATDAAKDATHDAVDATKDAVDATKDAADAAVDSSADAVKDGADAAKEVAP